MRPRRVNVYRVTAGRLTRDYFSQHHADQFARAMRLNGVKPVAVQLPNDALTRVTVSA